MTWLVFGGEHHELYLALLKARCERDGLHAGEETLLRQFRLHLHRGIGYLRLIRPPTSTPGAGWWCSC
jgi:DNA sulfur modification protein DndE